jgi:hypothetical protein
MGFVFSIVFLGGLIRVAGVYWDRLADAEKSFAQPGFWVWVRRGILVPSALWLLFNMGIVPGMPPLLPNLVLPGSIGQSWILYLLQISGLALFVIGSYWGMVTFSWLLARIAGKVWAGQRKEFIWTGVIWLLLLFPLTGSLVYLGGPWTIGLAVAVALGPVVHFALPLLPGKEVPPSYSRAVAKMQFGKFNEAELEVIQELERCADDFDGWMMLAELYALHFRDLSAAEQTVRDVCSQANISPSQFAVAFHRLADWHLKVGDDPVRARGALQAICDRAPDTHLERMARQRMNQLPASRKELLEERKGKKIYLPTASDLFSQNTPVSPSPTSALDATTSANQCVERLRHEPNDVAAREKLAHLFVEDLHQPERGIEQLELLIAMPGQPENRIAHWLSLSAAWQFRYRQDREATRKILARLVREYPHCLQAFAAQRHLNLMEMEQRRTAKGISEP